MELFDEISTANCEFLCKGVGYCKRQGMYISDFFIFCIECDCPNKKLFLGKRINNIPENKITMSCKNNLKTSFL